MLEKHRWLAIESGNEGTPKQDLDRWRGVHQGKEMSILGRRNLKEGIALLKIAGYLGLKKLHLGTWLHPEGEKKLLFLILGLGQKFA